MEAPAEAADYPNPAAERQPGRPPLEPICEPAQSCRVYATEAGAVVAARRSIARDQARAQQKLLPADRPEVVQGHHHAAPQPAGYGQHVGREAGQIVDVDTVWTEYTQRIDESPLAGGIGDVTSQTLERRFL